MALVLSLCVLLGVTSVAVALLAIGLLEPQISRNLADAARARGLAEAGAEVAYGRLAGADLGTWGPILAAADSANPWVTLAEGASPDGPRAGTYTIKVRNDLDTADRVLTGLPAGQEVGETATEDRNGVLIVQTTGAFNRSRVTIEAVLRRSPDEVVLFNRREMP